MKYYIIAGEASGDLHGSNLIKELKKQDAEADIRCWGGDLMQNAGGTLVKHYRDLAFMGFVEVVANLSTILKNLKFCKEDIEHFKPDALVLIDYPGFNLRIAEWGKQQGYKIVFYISPQVWAWKENRVKKMKQYIDKMLVILPFEKDYYKDRWQWDVEYVGHPLVQVIEHAQEDLKNEAPLANKKIIALLPGSRKQEVAKKLPVMLDVSKDFPDYQFIIAKAPSLTDDFFAQFIDQYPNVSTVSNQTYKLLLQSSAALVTSGTATLETALFGVPEVICYKGSPISYLIARQLIKVKYICLVNLIMDKEVVKELIQDEMNPVKIKEELNRLLNDETRKQQLQTEYAELKHLLTKGGDASANAARSIVEFVEGAR
jgi:lipid-A-disaccharide synthase